MLVVRSKFLLIVLMLAVGWVSQNRNCSLKANHKCLGLDSR